MEFPEGDPSCRYCLGLDASSLSQFKLEQESYRSLTLIRGGRPAHHCLWQHMEKSTLPTKASGVLLGTKGEGVDKLHLWFRRRPDFTCLYVVEERRSLFVKYTNSVQVQRGGRSPRGVAEAPRGKTSPFNTCGVPAGIRCHQVNYSAATGYHRRQEATPGS